MKMLGYKSRVSYYNHLDDEGWPQQRYPSGAKPMLVYEECVAYMEAIEGKRSKPTLQQTPGKPSPPGGKKRHVGRPAKPLR
ncbi:hypothetical protein X755_06965 [Mesorhizobium sp. LNJC405B00]|nr:hypothetical protein X755_06965 [Mesorhizobium sp. LNJC405B00]